MIDLELREQKPSELEELREEKPVSNVVSLVAVGGGGSGGPWLRDLDSGACFLARHGDSAMLHEFWIVAKANRAMKLLAIKGDQETYMWVDPVKFSKEFSCYEVLDP